MKWTHAKPTLIGWYWYKRDAKAIPNIVNMDNLQSVYCKFLLTNWEGSWAGPLNAPRGKAR